VEIVDVITAADDEEGAANSHPNPLEKKTTKTQRKSTWNRMNQKSQNTLKTRMAAMYTTKIMN
jgi:hypothetical protein